MQFHCLIWKAPFVLLHLHGRLATMSQGGDTWHPWSRGTEEWTIRLLLEEQTVEVGSEVADRVREGMHILWAALVLQVLFLLL